MQDGACCYPTCVIRFRTGLGLGDGPGLGAGGLHRHARIGRRPPAPGTLAAAFAKPPGSLAAAFARADGSAGAMATAADWVSRTAGALATGPGNQTQADSGDSLGALGEAVVEEGLRLLYGANPAFTPKPPHNNPSGHPSGASARAPHWRNFLLPEPPQAACIDRRSVPVGGGTGLPVPEEKDSEALEKQHTARTRRRGVAAGASNDTDSDVTVVLVLDDDDEEEEQEEDSNVLQCQAGRAQDLEARAHRAAQPPPQVGVGYSEFRARRGRQGDWCRPPASPAR